MSYRVFQVLQGLSDLQFLQGLTGLISLTWGADAPTFIVQYIPMSHDYTTSFCKTHRVLQFLLASHATFKQNMMLSRQSEQTINIEFHFHALFVIHMYFKLSSYNDFLNQLFRIKQNQSRALGQKRVFRLVAKDDVRHFSYQSCWLVALVTPYRLQHCVIYVHHTNRAQTTPPNNDLV